MLWLFRKRLTVTLNLVIYSGCVWIAYHRLEIALCYEKIPKFEPLFDRIWHFEIVCRFGKLKPSIWRLWREIRRSACLMKYKDSFNQCKHNSTACETRPHHDGWLSWLARNCGAAPFKYIIDSVWSVQWAEPTQGLAWGQRCWAPFRGSNWPCRTPAWAALGFPLGPTALRTGCG